MKQITMVIIGLSLLSLNLKAQEMNSLDKRQQKTVTIAANTAVGNLEQLKQELNGGLDAGLTVNEIKEVLVHLYAYCGFPRSLQGVNTFMAVLEERKTKGINDNWGREASPVINTRDKYERGKEILAKLSGTTPPAGRATAGYAGFSPEIDVFLKEHLFADIFERDVLSHSQREMVTVTILASLGGVEPQLLSHLNLALNTGLTPEQLTQLVTIIGNTLGQAKADAATPVLEEVLQSRGLNVNPATEIQNERQVYMRKK
jgi:alkylhydroperoxidase/carboxymuconolactone decarboxylase family protein YurZ